MKQLIYITLFLILLSACAKDKLFGDKAVLIGSWKWTQTNHSFGWCDNWEQSKTLTPENQKSNFMMEIYEKGIIKFYQNNEFLEKDRVVFSNSSGGECDYLKDGQRFIIDLNNDKELTGSFNGCVNKDSLMVGVFPFMIKEQGCESYVNYFVRE